VKIGDLVTFTIDYNADDIMDVGVVTRVFGRVAEIVWSWGPERHRMSGMTVLNGTLNFQKKENKNEHENL
jgi:hypothetical protein